MVLVQQQLGVSERTGLQGPGPDPLDAAAEPKVKKDEEALREDVV